MRRTLWRWTGRIVVALAALSGIPTVADEVAAPCPAGQFADAETGHCYACRPGFWRNPALSPETRGACYSPARREERAARRYDRASARGCRGGRFESRGYCYRCDIGFDRNPSFPPERRGACYRDYPDREEPALRRGPLDGTEPEKKPAPSR